MNFDDFISKWTGKGIDFDGAYGDQCMDLMHQYCVEVLGLTDGRILAAPAAKDVWNTNVFGKDKFDAFQNTPTGVPQKGDIILFGTEIGAYGHVAIVISADVNNIVSFDQNWNGHSYCEKVTHKYGGSQGVLGWLRFKGQPANGEQMVCDPKSVRDMLVNKATQRDDVCTYLGLPTDPTQTDSNKMTSTIGGYKSRVTDLTNQLTDAKAEVTNREEQVSRLKDQVTEEQNLRKSLSDKLNDAIKSATDATGVYEGQLSSKQTVIDGLAKEKGELKTQVAQLTQQLADAKKNSVKSLSVGDLVRLIVDKLRGEA
jgi:hypothetical protein